MDNRELDELVAVKVMGLDVTSMPIIDWADDRTMQLIDVPRYSTEIGATWEVVERMREMGWWYTLSDERWEGRHFAEFRRVKQAGVHQFRNAVADTPAEAICCAALAALGIEAPE